MANTNEDGGGHDKSQPPRQPGRVQDAHEARNAPASRGREKVGGGTDDDEAEDELFETDPQHW